MVKEIPETTPSSDVFFNATVPVGVALLYGYQGNSGNLSGSDDEKWLATQTLVWEFVTGCRNSASPYSQTSTTVYSLHFGSNYANSGARAAYDQIVSFMTRHSTIPSFMSAGKKDITKELAYKDGKYSLTLTDKNNSLSEYSFTSSDSNVKVSKSGNKLTITSKKAIDGKARITATRNNTPTVSSGAMMIAYGDPNLQDVITGVENVDTMTAYINVENPLFSVCVPTPDINYHRNVKVVFEVLISDFFTLRSEREMLRKVPKTKDFYEVFFCINTIVSTWGVWGDMSFIFVLCLISLQLKKVVVLFLDPILVTV